METAYVHYFSGTGNTLRAAHIIMEGLVRCGNKVTLLDITKPSPNLEMAPLHIVMFPVYGFGAPSLVLNYVRRLKAEHGTRAAIIAIGGTKGEAAGFEGQALNQVKSILARGGFTVTFSDFATYPENWTQFFNSPDTETTKIICQRADQSVAAFTDRIVNGCLSHRHTNRLLRTLTLPIFWSYHYIGRRFLGKLYVADNSCSGCSACAQVCPVSAITMKATKPMWNWQCVGCQRCINRCPSKSIQTSNARLIIIICTNLLPLYPAVLFARIFSWSPLAVLSGLSSYVLLNFLSCVVADYILRGLERNTATRGVFTSSFTKDYRRYRNPNI
ncbi:MAG: 4Fe-4S binding protein [Gorillibacterium sp.]|nr:4Fe-4S binding protein [Gorillibacterium sp.]